MKHDQQTAWRILFPISLGTCLSLIGDATLYVVLPTDWEVAGISLGAVGIILSANRFIRLGLNAPIGYLFDRVNRRPIFIGALLIGVLAYGLTALATGFRTLLIARLLWGMAWGGIWLGGNGIIMDVAAEAARGRWVGIYQSSFFLGVGLGAASGGILNDWLGYRGAMWTATGLIAFSAIVAWALLPETKGMRKQIAGKSGEAPAAFTNRRRAKKRWELASVAALIAAYRLTIAGIISPTFSFFLATKFGQEIQLGGNEIGVTTIAGIAVGVSSLVSILSAPIGGALSDRLGSRWRVISLAVGAGAIGFSLLAVGMPASIALGLPLIYASSGSAQSLATALMGDLGGRKKGRFLGALYTAGDIASAVGPPLAYQLIIPNGGTHATYWFSALTLSLILLIALYWARV